MNGSRIAPNLRREIRRQGELFELPLVDRNWGIRDACQKLRVRAAIEQHAAKLGGADALVARRNQPGFTMCDAAVTPLIAW